MQSTAFEREVSDILKKCTGLAYKSIKIQEGWGVYEPLLVDIFNADATVKTNALLTVDQCLDDRWVLTHEKLLVIASFLYTMSFRLQASWSHAPHCLYTATKCIRLMSELVSENPIEAGQGTSKGSIPVAFAPAKLSCLIDNTDASRISSPQMSLCHLHFSLESLRLSPEFQSLTRATLQECRASVESDDDVKRRNAAESIADKFLESFCSQQPLISIKGPNTSEQDEFSVAAACTFLWSEGFSINPDMISPLLSTYKAKVFFHNTFLPTTMAWNPVQPFFPWFEESGVRQLEELLLTEGFRENERVAELHATTMSSILRSERASTVKILTAYFPKEQLPIQSTIEFIKVSSNQKIILFAVAKNPEFWSRDQYVNQALEYLGIPETDAWRDKLIELSAH